MSIIEKAHALANAIVESEEYAALRKAEQDMMNDPAAQEVINRFNEIQNTLHDSDQEKDELHEKIEYIQREMENTPAIAAYLDAQDKVTRILEEVNFILGKAINGDDEACDSDGCGGGCCGCS